MPRPKLDLFQKKPIQHLQHCLFVSMVGAGSVSDNYKLVSALPHTGLILSEAQQYSHQSRLFRTPILVEYDDFDLSDSSLVKFKAWVKRIQDFPLYGVVITIVLGNGDEKDIRRMAKKMMAELR